jgi:hypothetical protein
VLPELDHVDYKKWKVIVDQYQLIRTYLTGTYVYSTANNIAQSNDMYDVPNPIAWPINVYLADHTVEDRDNQSKQHAEKSLQEKMNALLHETENRYDRSQVTESSNVISELSTTERNEFTERANRIKKPKPHQPRFDTETCNLSNQQEDSPLLTFPSKIGNSKVEKNVPMSTFLVDCGASRDFVSHSEVSKHALPTEVLPHKIRVVLSD